MDARIEQHIIGAYLSGRPLPAREAAHLRPHDLDHPLAVTIMEHIQQIRGVNPAVTEQQLATEIAGRVAEKGVTEPVMAGWSQQTITDGELAAMMRYALVGGANKEIRQWGEKIALACAMPHRWDENDVRHYQQHLQHAVARRYSDIGFAYEPDPDRSRNLDRFWFPDPLPAWEPTAERATVEEDILMHLLGHQGLCWAAAGVIDESLFTSEQRREVFRAIEGLEHPDFGPRYGQDRISAAAAEVMTSRSYDVADETSIDHGPGEALNLLQRIGPRSETDADTQQVFVLGRQLLAEDLCHSLHNASWGEGIGYRHDTAPAELTTPTVVTPDQNGPQLRP